MMNAVRLAFGLAKAAAPFAAGLALACARVLAHLVWRYL